MEEVNELSDKQAHFLNLVKRDMNLDENVLDTINFILENKEYSDFHKTILKDLRARYIRQSGLHSQPKYADQIHRINTGR